MGFLKSIGIFIGAIALFVCTVSIFEFLIPMLVDQKPFDPNLLNNPEELESFLAKKPTSSYIALVIAHGVAALIAGMVLGFGRLSQHAVIIFGGVAIAASLTNFYTLPGQPNWFAVLDALVYIPAAYLGYNWVLKAREYALERA